MLLFTRYKVKEWNWTSTKKKHLNSDRKQRKLQIKDSLELSDVLKIPKLRFPKFLDIFIAKEFFWGSIW